MGVTVPGVVLGFTGKLLPDGFGARLGRESAGEVENGGFEIPPELGNRVGGGEMEEPAGTGAVGNVVVGAPVVGNVVPGVIGVTIVVPGAGAVGRTTVGCVL
jgi:hypothetical protein